MELNYNLLIVDDVSENIQVAMNILKEQGYDFSYALNGSEAIELLKRNSFDLILLDVMMPDFNGFEVCEFMKNDPRLQDIPVIFLTARVDVDSIAKGFQVGGVDYITKPFHSNELIVRVKPIWSCIMQNGCYNKTTLCCKINSKTKNSEFCLNWNKIKRK